MTTSFTPIPWEQYIYWQTQDKKILKKINELIKDISRNNFEGIGKPEALKYELSGHWSRRIDSEHRLVYRIENQNIIIIGCRFHY